MSVATANFLFVKFMLSALDLTFIRLKTKTPILSRIGVFVINLNSYLTTTILIVLEVLEEEIFAK
jgi:hypothetical protein